MLIDFVSYFLLRSVLLFVYVFRVFIVVGIIVCIVSRVFVFRLLVFVFVVILVLVVVSRCSRKVERKH